MRFAYVTLTIMFLYYINTIFEESLNQLVYYVLLNFIIITNYSIKLNFKYLVKKDILRMVVAKIIMN